MTVTMAVAVSVHISRRLKAIWLIACIPQTHVSHTMRGRTEGDREFSILAKKSRNAIDLHTPHPPHVRYAARIQCRWPDSDFLMSTSCVSIAMQDMWLPTPLISTQTRVQIVDKLGTPPAALSQATTQPTSSNSTMA